MKCVLVLLAAALAAGTLAAVAHADGDPASDFLLTQQVFLPYDAKVPKPEQSRLASTVAAANKAGYKIRVALIWSRYDLGSVTSLWKQPRQYARFLAAELAFVYKQRLLIVMPNGFGFHARGDSGAREYALLSRLPIQSSPSGLAVAAERAVRTLARAGGVKVSAAVTTKTGTSSRSHDRIVIVLAAVALLAVLVLVRLALRSRRRPA
jgi:hypothetical protein